MERKKEDVDWEKSYDTGINVIPNKEYSGTGAEMPRTPDEESEAEEIRRKLELLKEEKEATYRAIERMDKGEVKIEKNIRLDPIFIEESKLSSRLELIAARHSSKCGGCCRFSHLHVITGREPRGSNVCGAEKYIMGSHGRDHYWRHMSRRYGTVEAAALLRDACGGGYHFVF